MNIKNKNNWLNLRVNIPKSHCGNSWNGRKKTIARKIIFIKLLKEKRRIKEWLMEPVLKNPPLKIKKEHSPISLE